MPNKHGRPTFLEIVREIWNDEKIVKNKDILHRLWQENMAYQRTLKPWSRFKWWVSLIALFFVRLPPTMIKQIKRLYRKEKWRLILNER